MPRYYADLHIHSKYSRATSADCDLEHLALWARKKGITVLGTGDFTHPAWREHLRQTLVPAEPGLFRLRPELEAAVAARLPPACHGATRFLLSVEISTIYKKGDRTRKVHHLVYAPGFDACERIVRRLARIGNLGSDGRPILGLDSRHLLEIVLESDPGSYLIPAHAWTPWFAVLGSRSGFDSVDECYGDLAPHVFALETGLSSDPPMNWRVSSLDRFRLISCSDAHSPEKLGREASAFDTPLDYFALRRALETGDGYVGTVEFFPEEGKYHMDGHRKCGVRLAPAETRRHAGRCPGCGDPVTVGVLHRVEALADRGEGVRPATAGRVRPLVPLPEILAELQGVGAGSRGVARELDRLTARLGPELFLLEDAPLEEVRRAGPPLLAEALARLRAGDVRREAGYDGEYGRIRLFDEDELRRRTRGVPLFGSPETPAAAAPVAAEEPQPQPPPAAEPPREAPPSAAAPSAAAAGLDPEQQAAVEIAFGPLLIVAGPGSGKTRTLTHRLAALVARHGAAPESCLALTFTRRAAEQMRERLRALLPGSGERFPVYTFHGLGHAILRADPAAAGLGEGFELVDEPRRLALLAELFGVADAQARRLAGRLERARRAGAPVPGLAAADPETAEAVARYEGALRARNLVDLEDLVLRAAAALEGDAALAARYRERWRWVSVDEYQDLDAGQYRLVRLLAPPAGNLCVIGDPDQAIYGFRGADPGLFQRLAEDFPGLRVVRLQRNYRSTATIVGAAGQVIAAAGTGDRPMQAVRGGERPLVLHEAPSEAAEAEFVVQSLERLFGGHTFFSLDSGRAGGGEGGGLSFSDVAVLYRTEAQAEALAEALGRSGIPFQRRSHGPLSAHAGVQALAARLRREPGAGTLRARLEAAAAALIDADAAQAALVRDGAELLGPLAEACDGLPGFLAELALGTEADAWDPRAERVSLLTLHASKGLEFEAVFVTGCEDGLLPLRWGGGATDADAAEERRLFYVGMTRARQRLWLTRARRRLWRGRVQEAAPSPFLADIEERWLERERSSARPRPRPAMQRSLF